MAESSNINGNGIDTTAGVDLGDITDDIISSANITAIDGFFTNIDVTDTLTVNTIISQEELQISDPLIVLGVDNNDDAINLGLLLEYENPVATNKWAGIVRSEDDKKFYFFEDEFTKPTTTTDISLAQRADIVVNRVTAFQLEATSELQVNGKITGDDIELSKTTPTDNARIIFRDDLGAEKFRIQLNAINELEFLKDISNSILKLKTDGSFEFREGVVVMDGVDGDGNSLLLLQRENGVGKRSHIQFAESGGSSNWEILHLDNNFSIYDIANNNVNLTMVGDSSQMLLTADTVLSIPDVGHVDTDHTYNITARGDADAKLELGTNGAAKWEFKSEGSVGDDLTITQRPDNIEVINIDHVTREIKLKQDVVIGSNVGNVDANFEVQHATAKGSIPAPIMTELQRDAILTPSAGLQVYNTNTNSLQIYNGTSWNDTDVSAFATIFGSPVENNIVAWKSPTSIQPAGFDGDDIVLKTATQTITNKDLLSTTNDIKASQIRDVSGTGLIFDDFATPAVEQILKTTSGTHMELFDHTLVNIKDVDIISVADGEVLTYETSSGLWKNKTASAGDVVGPASAVSDNLASYDGTTGKLIKDSGVSLAGGSMDIPGDLTFRSAVFSPALPALAGIFTQTADKQITNTITETSLVGTGIGSMSIPANTISVGTTVSVLVSGCIETNGSEDMTLKFKIGGTTVYNSGLVTISANAERNFTMTIHGCFRSIGASGSLVFNGKQEYFKDDNTVEGTSIQSAPVVVDTTVANVLDITWKWAVANVDNKITSKILSLTTLY